jgi:phage shock protein E
MLNIIKQLLGLGPKIDYRKLVQSGAVILDVRTPAEFKSGHIKGAINIPVDKLQSNLAKVQAMNKPVITCCRSGARSGMAVGILKKAGMEAYNGGPWNALRSKIS